MLRNEAENMLLERIKEYGVQKILWAGTRIALGWTFIWAFFDKLLGLGYATQSANAWVNGGSPTTGFLKFATSGPLSDFYSGLAGNAVVDWLFMMGLLFIGGALLLGIGVRIASYAGTLLMLLMWSSRLPPENNPIIDEHIVYILVLLTLGVVKAGQYLGLGKWWANTGWVKRFPILE